MMDVTTTLSLGDPLEPARKATAQMLQERERTFSLPQPFYSDERLFDIDMQEIFQKEWLIAGMTCEIPTKGNYLTLQVGKNPIIVIRGADGIVHAFHNVCRHRGSRLCTSEKGKVAKLVCHYHQWTYELDGRLLFAGTEMGADFDMKQYGLKPVNVKTAGGYIFISLAENPPAIDDFLSTLNHYMEPYDMENTKVAITTTLMEKANWKLVLENNRECYHCNASHPELLKTLLEWDDVTDPRADQAFKDHVAASAAAWEAEKIPYAHASFGLRNRIVRMPLLKGTVSMTLDGKQGCAKLMGRIKNPDLARCASCTCRTRGTTAWATTSSSSPYGRSAPRKPWSPPNGWCTRMRSKAWITTSSACARCGTRPTIKTGVWPKRTSAGSTPRLISQGRTPRPMSLAWSTSWIGTASGC